MLSALFFYPRGGSAQVARALAGALPEAGWRMTLATGSLGGAGDPTNAAGFYSGIEVFAVDYSPALELADPLAAPVPFQPGSYPPTTSWRAAALIETASDTDERRRRGQRAATEARQHYGWTMIAKQIAGLYEEVVAQRDSERAETRVLATPQAADRPPDATPAALTFDPKARR